MFKQLLTTALALSLCLLPSMAAEPNAKRLRVIMCSDFPPIGVVKGGNVPNTMKSDPDDMQSMVRFLLYANEFEVEGLIASAGTFAMEAHKKNILGVLDRYEKVYENLEKHDPRYPTADYLRSVTFEGKGNNHGVKIEWGQGKQPYTDIIGKGMDSEASKAIIAAADKPDPRPIWIGVWGGPREIAQETVDPGSTIELSAVGSSDADGNDLNYSWSFYKEPSSFKGSVTIADSSSQTAQVRIPADAAAQSIHIILEIHDDGSPNLYAYRRVILNAKKSAQSPIR